MAKRNKTEVLENEDKAHGAERNVCVACGGVEFQAAEESKAHAKRDHKR